MKTMKRQQQEADNRRATQMVAIGCLMLTVAWAMIIVDYFQ